MNHRSIVPTLAFCALFLLPATAALAQGDDGNWDDRFHRLDSSGLGMSASVLAVATSPTAVYAGGTFTLAGELNTSKIARFDGVQWNAMGFGVTGGDVFAIAVDGNDVYVGGSFNNASGTIVNRIARWDGSKWNAMGTGVAGGDVLAIAVEGGEVFVGGTFTTAGGNAALRIAVWDGNSWDNLGVGPSNTVRAIEAVGTDVFIGGDFVTVSGTNASRIAQWDGNSWSALDGGLNGPVHAIGNDGSSLYVGGEFTAADGGGVSALNVAEWDGNSWNNLGIGVNGRVNAVEHTGGILYIGGQFVTTGTNNLSRIGEWSGSAWVNLGSGTTDEVTALSGRGDNLYAGGFFNGAGAKQAMFFSRYNPNIVPILISSFRAQPRATGIRLSWNLYADEKISGFRVYRREQGSDAYVIVAPATSVGPEARSWLDTGVSPGVTYEYRLGALRPDGSEVASPVTRATAPVSAFHLDQNYPNPFNPATAIRFTLPEAGVATLTILDVQGRHVRTLIHGSRPAGGQEVRWDGRDEAGNIAAAGVYLARLEADHGIRTIKMVLMK